MKKFLIIALMSITVLSIAGCSKQEKAYDTTATSTSPTEKATASEVSFDMEESDLKTEYLSIYREKSKGEKFISDIETSVYEELNFDIRNEEDGYISSYNSIYNEIHEYYYPIVLKGTDEVIIAYVDSMGRLSTYNSSKDTCNYYSNIHAEDDVLVSYANYALVLKGERLELWQFGEKVSEVSLPANSEYVGSSRWEGYIFRHEEDVYAVQVEDEELICEAIAHGVDSVIVTDYRYTSDAFSQPLFLMKDGSIKVYCGWAGEGAADDQSHLVEPLYEGGDK